MKNSGLKTSDFSIGEEIIVLDPSGNVSHFIKGDICIVDSLGESCVYVKIKRTGRSSKMYAYRFAKLNGFKIKDLVEYEGSQGTVVSFEGQHCLVSFGRDLISKHSNELTLLGRKKLI